MSADFGDHPLVTVPVPTSGRGGPIDWTMLAEVLPISPSAGARLAVPEGWVELPFAGYDQGAVFERGGNYAGNLTQITVRHVADELPAALIEQVTPRGGFALGVEPWVSGTWHGVHVAWIIPRFGSRTIQRTWVLRQDADESVVVTAHCNASLERHLGPMVEGMTSSLTPSPPALRDQAAELEHSARSAAEVLSVVCPAGREPLVAAAAVKPPSDRAASQVHHVSAAPRNRFWVVGSPARRVTDREKHLGQVDLIDDLCLVRQGGAPAEGLPEDTDLGPFPRDAAAEMVLRLVEHRAAGVSDTPVTLLSSDSFNRRLNDPAEPLSAAIPDAARVSTTMTAQEIHRWWTADWDWWMLYTEESPEETGAAQPVHRGIRILRVDGFGHYEWRVVGDRPGQQGTMVELTPIDGLSIFHAVDEVLTPRS